MSQNRRVMTDAQWFTAVSATRRRHIDPKLFLIGLVFSLSLWFLVVWLALKLA